MAKNETKEFENKVKNIIVNIRAFIERGKNYSSAYDLVEVNLDEDLTFYVKSYARKGIMLNKVFRLYQQCIDEINNGYADNKAETEELQKKLDSMRQIAEDTESTRV